MSLKKWAKNLHSKERKGKLLLGSSIFLSYPVGDELSTQAEKVVKCAVEGTLEAFTSSMIYDDVISGLRSKGMTFNEKLADSHRYCINAPTQLFR